MLAFSAVAAPAMAGVIDFESHGDDFGDPIVESGFNFEFVSSGWGVFGPQSGACCEVDCNGTTAMFANGDRDSSTAQVVMSRQGGGTFDIAGFDASVYVVDTVGEIEVIVTFQGGGSTRMTLELGPIWQNVSLSMTHLVSLTIRDTASGGFLSVPGWGVDNIDFSAAPVPEPGTWAMMLAGVAGVAGVAGLGAAVRRRSG